jgi:hypothetical protein
MRPSVQNSLVMPVALRFDQDAKRGLSDTQGDAWINSMRLGTPTFLELLWGPAVCNLSDERIQ